MHKFRTLFLSWDIEKSSLIALRCAAMREVAASRATVPISWSCWYWVIMRDKEQSFDFMHNISGRFFLARVVDRWSLFAVIFLYKLDCSCAKKQSWKQVVAIQVGRFSQVLLYDPARAPPPPPPPWNLEKNSVVECKGTTMSVKIYLGFLITE